MKKSTTRSRRRTRTIVMVLPNGPPVNQLTDGMNYPLTNRFLGE
jgi:hypothetical protein